MVEPNENNERKFLRLADIECYRISFALSNAVWDCVLAWPPLAQHTVGEQFVRAVDSISANIAEGFGRYSKKDKIRFYRIARGSLYESLDWNEKARVRQIITSETYTYLFTELQRLPKSINSLIKYTDSHLTI
ncbi:four helix bundle protein [Hymenobacter yonginensis]|uniref:Four helix bundle protein n=1 Tax=Hymenobacter yonginensis TaxID=748197 RepID=A0ABY7PJ21_9BACT|nr:four helix bundle protein [Hymenobacter yonginensis]WBO83067.1 four helix bundle protein [Hymenobacter yonginensis]